MIRHGGQALKAQITPYFAALLVLGLTGPVAAAETVTCADADRRIIFTYITDTHATQPILTVEMQLTDDYGLSTDPTHPDHSGEYVSHGFIIEDIEGADLSIPYDAGALRVMSFRIGRVYEARQALVGGVVSVAGGGFWTVTCHSDEVET